jgi:hypothetical protein
LEREPQRKLNYPRKVELAADHAEGSAGTAAAESFKLNELHSVKEVKSFSTKLQIDHIWRPGTTISIMTTRLYRPLAFVAVAGVWRSNSHGGHDVSDHIVTAQNIGDSQFRLFRLVAPSPAAYLLP